MRVSGPKKRVRGRGAASGAFFPFLAVLVCTLGALVVVLVLVARQSRCQAEQVASPDASEAEKELTATREMVQWRTTELMGAEKHAEEELAQARLALGYSEQRVRELRERFARLETVWKDLSTSTSPPGDRAALEAERERLLREIMDAEKQVAEARLAAGEKQRYYAIVPYEGPNGTQRRPIYIECRADAIVLQPEGIALVDGDFALLSPDGKNEDNPLARAVRAARASMIKRGSIRGGADEPYPLLLVRPEGIVAYYCARAALRSWTGDVGYELIGNDWNLRFPKPDTALAEDIRAAVDEARAEMRQKRAMIALTQGNGRGSQEGGFEGSGTDGSDRPSGSGGPMGSGGSMGSGGEGGFGGAGGRAASGGTASIAGGSKPTPQGKYRLAPGGGLIREDGPEKETTSFRPQSPGSAVGSRYAAASRTAQRPRPEGVIAAPKTERSAASREGRAMRPGEWEEPSPRPSGRVEEKPDDKPSPKSLAEKRGKDWALRDATPSAVGLTRMVPVRCRANAIELMSESGNVPRQIIPLDRATEDVMDAFVSAVWDHMKGWGIAGRGMYWKPVLNVQVLPGGEARFEEVRALLEGSGVEVKKRG
jgi:hypothetical protein